MHLHVGPHLTTTHEIPPDPYRRGVALANFRCSTVSPEIQGIQGDSQISTKNIFIMTVTLPNPKISVIMKPFHNAPYMTP